MRESSIRRRRPSRTSIGGRPTTSEAGSVTVRPASRTSRPRMSPIRSWSPRRGAGSDRIRESHRDLNDELRKQRNFPQRMDPAPAARSGRSRADRSARSVPVSRGRPLDHRLRAGPTSRLRRRTERTPHRRPAPAAGCLGGRPASSGRAGRFGRRDRPEPPDVRLGAGRRRIHRRALGRGHRLHGGTRDRGQRVRHSRDGWPRAGALARPPAAAQRGPPPSGRRHPRHRRGHRPSLVRGARPTIRSCCGTSTTRPARRSVAATTDAEGGETEPNLIDPLEGLIDPFFGHGTFIAGIIRQTCPDARLLSVKIMDNDGIVEEADLINALGFLHQRQDEGSERRSRRGPGRRRLALAGLLPRGHRRGQSSTTPRSATRSKRWESRASSSSPRPATTPRPDRCSRRDSRRTATACCRMAPRPR